MASLSSRYRVEDLRRLVAQLVAGLGVAPNRGAAFASHLLWFEAAGASPFGIASLAGWLDRLETQNIEPGSVGRAHSERAGTAVYDSRGGLPPLELATASGIAAEKARDAGIGVVRVERLGEVGSSAPVAAGLAIGPNLALIVGPDREWSAALPIPGGLPAVYDSVLARASGGSPLKPTLAPDDPFSVLGPWLSAFSGGGGWVIIALSVTVIEPLASFHDRAKALFPNVPGSPGLILPDAWEAGRGAINERGIAIGPEVEATLKAWGARLQVSWPTPLGPT